MYEDKKIENWNNEYIYSTIQWHKALLSFSIKLYNTKTVCLRLCAYSFLHLAICMWQRQLHLCRFWGNTFCYSYVGGSFCCHFTGDCFCCNYTLRSFCSTYVGNSFCSKYVGENFYCNYAGGIFCSAPCTSLFLW